MHRRPVQRSRAKTAAALSLALLTFGSGGLAAATSAPATARAVAGKPVAAKQSVAAKAVASFPQAGPLVRSSVVVRSAPSRSSRSLKVLKQFRPDNRATVVFAVGAVRDARGTTWYSIEVPGRPNGLMGWIPANAVRLYEVHTKIVVDRGKRQLTLYDHGRVRLRTKVAVGKPGIETPTGTFYIQAAYAATERALGVFAFETSAYSKLSDWPGGGIVGIHGTPYPNLLGTAASHGCVRVSNAAALTLKRFVPVGTAVSIVD